VSISPGYERRYVGKDLGQPESSTVHEIFRLPLRMELFLVLAQPLEVVERPAVFEQERSEPGPERRHRRSFESRKGSHAEREPTIAAGLSPRHHTDEDPFHHFPGCAFPVAHQIDRELVLICTGPDVRKGQDLALLVDNCDGKSLQVLRIEKPERKPLL